jgi:hypothetical protein
MVKRFLISFELPGDVLSTADIGGACKYGSRSLAESDRDALNQSCVTISPEGVLRRVCRDFRVEAFADGFLIAFEVLTEPESLVLPSRKT